MVCKAEIKDAVVKYLSEECAALYADIGVELMFAVPAEQWPSSVVAAVDKLNALEKQLLNLVGCFEVDGVFFVGDEVVIHA